MTTESKIRGRSFTAKDQLELAVLLVYIVQVKGECSLHDMKTFIEETLNSKCRIETLSKVAEQLRKRGFFVANQVIAERCYSMGKVKFNRGSNVETAHTHVDGLISSLYEEPAGMAIVAEIRGELGMKEPKNQGDYPRAWGTYKVKMVLETEWLGSIPIQANPIVMDEYQRSPYQVVDFNCDPKDMPLVFRRGPTGGLLVHADCVRGFFEKHLPALGMSPTHIRYFHIGPIEVHPSKEQLEVKKLAHGVFKSPIQRQEAHTGGGQAASGAGFGYYEAVLAGTEIEWEFDAPTENFPTLASIEFWLRKCLQRSARFMSPARGGQTGSAKLLSLELEKWPAIDKQMTKKNNGTETQAVSSEEMSSSSQA